MKKFLISLLKYSVSFGLIFWIVRDVLINDPKAFSKILQPENPLILFAALCICMSAVTTTIVRWYLLVRALGLPFRLRDAFQLGLLGYLLNFVSVGSVGGDLFKAVFIARRNPGHRTEAVATIIIDRLIGLYGLMLVASFGILINGFPFDRQVLTNIASMVLIITSVSTVIVGLALTPGFSEGKLAGLLARIPKIGPTIDRLLGAVRIYRRRLPTLGLAGLMTLGVHCLLASGIYLIACGLPVEHPNFVEHFVVVPMSMFVGILPLPAAGLGAFEIAMETLYPKVSISNVVQQGQGLIVALGYRVITIVIAAIGLCYYLISRKEVAEVIHEAAEQQDPPDVQRPST